MEEARWTVQCAAAITGGQTGSKVPARQSVVQLSQASPQPAPPTMYDSVDALNDGAGHAHLERQLVRRPASEHALRHSGHRGLDGIQRLAAAQAQAHGAVAAQVPRARQYQVAHACRRATRAADGIARPLRQQALRLQNTAGAGGAKWSWW